MDDHLFKTKSKYVGLSDAELIAKYNALAVRQEQAPDVNHYSVPNSKDVDVLRIHCALEMGEIEGILAERGIEVSRPQKTKVTKK